MASISTHFTIGLERCLFLERCWAEKKTEKCPRYWDKYKVCSDENPHECKYLIEQTGEQYD